MYTGNSETLEPENYSLTWTADIEPEVVSFGEGTLRASATLMVYLAVVSAEQEVRVPVLTCDNKNITLNVGAVLEN